MAYIVIEDYYRFKNYIHPHIKECIDHQRHKNIIHLPACQSCDIVNKNSTRKLVDYRRGSQCFYPTDKGYWRKTKSKYRINYIYFTQYMSQYGLQSLAKSLSLGKKFQNIFITDILDLMATNIDKFDYIINYIAKRQMAKDLLDKIE